jgi:hypothetical protein
MFGMVIRRLSQATEWISGIFHVLGLWQDWRRLRNKLRISGNLCFVSGALPAL